MTPESMLNGCVQAQGLKIDVDHWLVMGSKEWGNTPDEVKAWAYQAAIVTGWTDDALCQILKTKAPAIFTDEFCTVILSELKELAQKHRLEEKK